ncbi:MAG: hypothetical protein Kow00124_01390 [Anaerolineae bacterium]
MKLRLTALTLVILMVALTVPASACAQDEPVVFAVLFYSPSCPHCHEVITQDWPVWQQEFGDRLQLLFVDVTVPGGRDLFMSALTYYEVPQEIAGGVPMLIVGDQYLIGSQDIPNQFPDIVREALRTGGLELPGVPGLREAYQAALQAQQEAGSAGGETGGEQTEQAGQTAPEEANPAGAPVAEAVEPESLSARIAADPGNYLAIAVLLGLVVSIAAVLGGGAAVIRGLALPAWITGQGGHVVAVITAAATLLLAVTLIAAPDSTLLTFGLGMAVAAAMLISIVVLLMARASRAQDPAGNVDAPGWLIPLAAAVGLGVALYLVYIETTASTAVCGAVGDCNTVQQSVYATLFGLIPIAVLGAAGYAAMLVTWGVGQIGNSAMRRLAQGALLVMALAGVAFSIYLTFLEPFVIGATCAWCLTSALIMLLLLWLTLADGLEALRRGARRA